MKTTLLPLLGFALLASASGCLESPILKHAKAGAPSDQAQLDAACPLAFPNAGLCASLEWEVRPSADDRGAFLLRFWSAKTGTEHGPYVAPALELFVQPFMESMNHGTPVPVRIESVLDSGRQPIPGVYRASDVSLFMPGEWAIRIQLRENRQVREQARAFITI